jgi:hypothetical protein
MTAVIDQRAAAEAPVPLAPVTATLRSMFGTDDLPGLARGLMAPTNGAGWVPATALTDGSKLPDFLSAAARRWRGSSPHAAAALAWKAYTYWLALPAVLGWAAARRVPLLSAADIAVHIEDHRPLLMVGLLPTTQIAVLPSDPLAMDGHPSVIVVPDERALLDAFRVSLIDSHVDPLLDALHGRVRIGARTLMGSLSSGVAYGLIRAADVLPGSTQGNIETVLGALGIDDLIDLVPGPAGQLSVQRKTCCLAFTLPEPKLCTGCVIKR